jgi:hypothetical protein
VKQISIFVFGFVAFASASAPAQDLTAGKTPAQLFRSDCAECHRSPNGLARTRDVRTLADFLREHYTTKSETAGALAAYVSEFAAGGAAARNRGAGATPPATDGHRRNRGEGEATANGEDAPSQATAAKETGRHRRTTGLSGDGEKRRIDNDGEVPRPPGGILTTPASSKSNARTRTRDPRDARLRSNSPSERGTESATEEAGKTGAPTARKRRHRVNAERAAPDVGVRTETSTDKPQSDTSGPTVPGMPQQGDGSPTVPSAVTPP